MMHTRRWMRRGVTGMGLAFPLALAPQLNVSVLAGGSAFADADDTAHLVDVQGLHAEGSTMSGRIVNRSEEAIGAVRLTITDNFLWNDGRQPRSDNPSRAAQFSVPGPIPPRGTLEFSYTRHSALPDRPDGRFRTAVSVTSVTTQPLIAPE